MFVSGLPRLHLRAVPLERLCAQPAACSAVRREVLQTSALAGGSEEWQRSRSAESQQSIAEKRMRDYIVFPARPAPGNEQPRKDPTLVRVKLSVSYRVHSRQILCIGGSQIPFGWSFLSISKIPMVWGEGDIWSAEVSY